MPDGISARNRDDSVVILRERQPGGHPARALVKGVILREQALVVILRERSER